MHFLSEMSMLVFTLLVFPPVAFLLLGFNLLWNEFKDPILQLIESNPNGVVLGALAVLTITMIVLCFLYRKEKNQKVNLKELELTEPAISDNLSKNELMLNNIKNWK